MRHSGSRSDGEVEPFYVHDPASLRCAGRVISSRRGGDQAAAPPGQQLPSIRQQVGVWHPAQVATERSQQ